MNNFLKRLLIAAKIVAAPILNRFRAARYTVRRSLISTSPKDARFNYSQSDRTIIAEKAKEFEDNNAVAQRLAEVFVDYTVGPEGLVLIPHSTDPAWNAAAKAYWQTTCNFIDLRSRQNFGILQNLCAWRWFFDGEIFIHKTRAKAANGKTFPRIELLEYFLCQTPPNMAKEEGKTIIDGISIDDVGRPVAYWFRESSESNIYRSIDATEIIHIFEPARPGQYRGISFLHAALNYLHLLDDLQELEFRALTDAAEKSTFVISQNGEMPPGFTGGLPGDGFGMGGIAPSSTNTSTDQLREAVGGRSVALQVGEDVKQFLPQRPTESTRYLWSYLTSCVCGAVGIPKLLAFSEWLENAQGTIVRGDYDIANQFFRARSSVLSAAFREVYIYVIGWGIRTDKTIADVPGDGSWVNVTLRPPRAPNVDIGRNDSAESQQLADGRTNYDLIYAPRGLDWQEELTKLAQQKAFIKQLEIEYRLEPGELIESTKPEPQPVPVQPQPIEP